MPLSDALHFIHDQPRFGDSTTEHDHIGVERVDKRCSRPAEVVGRTSEGAQRQQISTVGKFGNCSGRLCIVHRHEALRPSRQRASDVPLDAGSGSSGLQTAMPAAATQKALLDHGKVSYFTCKAVTTNIQMPVHDQRSSYPSPHSEHDDIAAADGNPTDPLGEERTLGIVFQIRWSTSGPTHDIHKRYISHPWHVGREQQHSALLIDYAGTPNAGSHDDRSCVRRPPTEIVHSAQNKL